MQISAAGVSVWQARWNSATHFICFCWSPLRNEALLPNQTMGKGDSATAMSNSSEPVAARGSSFFHQVFGQDFGGRPAATLIVIANENTSPYCGTAARSTV
jgi:hypothetical protein